VRQRERLVAAVGAPFDARLLGALSRTVGVASSVAATAL